MPLYQGKNLRLRQCSAAILVFMSWWVFHTPSVLAAERRQSEQDEFAPSPLEITMPDPLLPRPVVDMPLSPAERQTLVLALEQLDAQADAQLQAGNREAAFETWNRELRLRRLLGPLAEIEALQRVGAIAWSENARAEVQAITQRLQIIQQQAQLQPATNPGLLAALGGAYQQVRAPQQAIDIYSQILVAARQRRDPAAIETTLRTLAELHLSKFDYPEAVAAYGELLGAARARGDRDSEIVYIQQLAYIYQQSQQYQQAIELRQELVDIYLNAKNITLIPALRLEIASNYESLGQIELAFQNYQEAYASAWSLQQYERASDALRRLISLYRSRNQTNEALQATKILLAAEQLADNSYGMMNTYDQLGQFNLQNNNYTEALAAFENGLRIAQQLNIQQPYFTEQITKVKQRLSN